MLRELTLSQEDEQLRKHKSLTPAQKERVKELEKEEKKLIEENAKKQELANERNRNELSKPFTSFLSDPLAYLQSQIEQGEWSGRQGRYELYSLLTGIRKNEILQEILEELKRNKK